MQMSEAEKNARHIWERWSSTLGSGDLDGCMALYAENAVIETPAVLAIFKDKEEGILYGREEIRKLFALVLQRLKGSFKELYRTNQYFFDGRLLTWEFPRKTPDGEQLDLFESMDIENGLIVYHRVYWGWKGFKALQGVAKSL